MTKSIHNITNKIAPFQIKIELVLLSILLVGIFLKDPELYYYLIILPSLILASVHYLMAFSLINPINAMQAFLHKLTYLTFALGSMGVAFSILHYPGSLLMLNVAILIIIAILVAQVVMKFRDNKKGQIIDNNLIRIIIFTLVLALIMTMGF